ncbi:MAG: hypothetical protein LLG37_02775 [Spirochaetia bacterium]|nr:hypothetical protein [Spirochaetia bacterium]
MSSKKRGNSRYGRMDSYLKKQIKSGKIRKVDTIQLLISLVSQLAPVYMASSFIKGIAGLNNVAGTAVQSLIDSRKEFVMKLVMDGIKK